MKTIGKILCWLGFHRWKTHEIGIELKYPRCYRCHYPKPETWNEE